MAPQSPQHLTRCKAGFTKSREAIGGREELEYPFKIAVLDEARAPHLPGEVNVAELAYGALLADIRRLASRWKDGYDWCTQERALNTVHYVHLRSTAKGAIPLLFVHGLLGNVLEVTKVLPLLTAVSADHPSFHVVAPSLPGFAWSGGVLEKGFHAIHYAEPMIPLGYSEYVTQGRDWGHVVRTLYYRQHVGNFESIIGYSAEQATKPQTIGFSLADSPVDLLAWKYEKLVAWTDAISQAQVPVTGNLTGLVSAVLTGQFPHPGQPVLLYFPKDPVQFPRVKGSWLRAQAKFVFESEHDVGGHFAAYEQPEALVSDLRKVFGKFGPASIVPGCTGC
ncbi:alpha/beta-hydrolase [Lactarius psammicola]|nr:alpha/beta-hydrolase [Lactarius psammicola]